jgi:pyruvate/2-oxoglutarate dehydrogenase complex dihydrolipoamide acyltransferase (E2) component
MKKSPVAESKSPSLPEQGAPAPVSKDAMPAPKADGERVFASPLARRLAQAAGLDLKAIAGSGPHGRVIKADVDAAPHAAHRCDVRSVPCLVLLRDGVPVARKLGFYAREKLLGWVEAQMQGAA